MVDQYSQSYLKVLTHVRISWKMPSSKYYLINKHEYIDIILQYILFIKPRYINTNGFDGIEIDWRWPNGASGTTDDKINFISLLKVKVPKQAVHKDQIISKYKKQIFANSESLPNSHYVPSISKDQAHVFIQAGKKTMA